MTNNFTKKEKKAEVVHTSHQPQIQNLNTPPKASVVKKITDSYQQALEHRSQGFSL